MNEIVEILENYFEETDKYLAGKNTCITNRKNRRAIDPLDILKSIKVK